MGLFEEKLADVESQIDNQKQIAVVQEPTHIRSLLDDLDSPVTKQIATVQETTHSRDNLFTCFEYKENIFIWGIIVSLILFFIIFFDAKNRLKKVKTTKLQRLGLLLITFSIPICFITILVAIFNYFHYFQILFLCYAAFIVGALLGLKIPQKMFDWINGGEPD